jgi:hypothetical protein
MSLTTEQREANARLAEDLRNPHHHQGFGALRTDRTAAMTQGCCLGWACRRYHLDTGEGQWVFNEASETWFFQLRTGEGQDAYFTNADTFPPKVVADHFGWDTYNPLLASGLGTAALLNDGANYTLAQIGDLFEATYANAPEDEPEVS